MRFNCFYNRPLVFCSIESLYDISFSIGIIDRTFRRRHMKKTPFQRPKSKTSHAMKQRALQKLQKHRKSAYSSKCKWWQHPAVYICSFMCLIILIIPTLIVVPFSNADSKAESASEEKAAPQHEAKKKIEEDDQTLQVSVERQATNQVEDVSLENYVKGVVASEMPIAFEEEALKAQSLAARTYIINHLTVDGEEKKKKVTDGVEHQVYKNDEELRQVWGSDYEENMKKLEKAVAATKGEIITHKKEPITPAFFSTSNGYTENSEDYWDNKLPYLRSVKSPWDEESPEFYNQEIVTAAEFSNILGVGANAVEPQAIQVARTKSGRVDSVQIGNETFTGREIREKLNLPSSDFEIEKKENHIVLKTKGYGHGVGMSQYGANGMAKEGKSYKDIINYYYQDIEIRSIKEATPALVKK